MDHQRLVFSMASVRLSLLAATALLVTSLVAHADTCSNIAGNLVSNCGFETGNFDGWFGTTTADSSSGDDGVDNEDPYQGNYEAYLGSSGSPTTLSQTLSTVAGQQYTIQFALDSTLPGSTSYPNSFSADFGNSVLFSETDAVASSYQLYTFTVTASSSSTSLAFLSSNDLGYFDLDDVSATPVTAATTPEPTSIALLGTGLLGLAGVARKRFAA